MRARSALSARPARGSRLHSASCRAGPRDRLRNGALDPGPRSSFRARRRLRVSRRGVVVRFLELGDRPSSSPAARVSRDRFPPRGGDRVGRRQLRRIRDRVDRTRPEAPRGERRGGAPVPPTRRARCLAVVQITVHAVAVPRPIRTARFVHEFGGLECPLIPAPARAAKLATASRRVDDARFAVADRRAASSWPPRRASPWCARNSGSAARPR